MASECESGDGMPQHGQHEHLRPNGTEPLSIIAVDYTPGACHHARATGEIHVTYDHRGGARWRSPGRFIPGGAVAAAVRAPAGDTAGLNYNLYLSSLEGSPDMDEIDFEFLGGDKRAVQTNFYVGGCGGREMVHALPFDSSDGFHHYAVAWGAEAIEWRVDGEVVRREERPEGEGQPWPEKPMFLYASLWDRRAGSTRGGGPAATEKSWFPSRFQSQQKKKNAKMMPEMPPVPPAVLLPWSTRMPELMKIRSWSCFVGAPGGENHE